MGGVHANMVASLYPEAVALTPLLSPRSAAGAYCSGALYHATAWSQVGAAAWWQCSQPMAVLPLAGECALHPLRYLGLRQPVDPHDF